MKTKYRIFADKENPYDKVIEGVTIQKKWVTHFTIGDIEDDIAQLSKVKQELESKSEYEKAKIQNIKNQHPDIDLDIDEKIQIAYTINQQAKSYIKEASRKIAEINKQLEDYVEDLKDIITQTGIRLPAEPEEADKEEKDETK